MFDRKRIIYKILSSQFLELKEKLRYEKKQREVKQSGQPAAGGEFFFGIFFKTISDFPKKIKFQNFGT
jgi:hypothetical protein